MRLCKLEIAAFGGLRDVSLAFEPGLNVVLGANESGKSTLMQFVHAMFYGFGRVQRRLERDARRLAQPWDGETMSGSIHFLHAGREYLLYRRFGARKADDLCELRLAGSGEQLTLADRDRPGRELFGISESEFLNTVFVRQLELAVEATPELTRRVFGFAEEAADGDVVRQRLKEARRALQGRNGRLAQDEAQLAALHADYAAALETDRRVADVLRRLDEIDARQAAIATRFRQSEEQGELFSAIELLERRQALEGLAAEAAARDQAAGAIELTAAGRDITVHQLAELSDDWAEVERLAHEARLYSDLARQKRQAEADAAEHYDALAERRQEALAAVRQDEERPLAEPRELPPVSRLPLLFAGATSLALFLGALLIGSRHALFWPLMALALLAPFLAGVVHSARTTSQRKLTAGRWHRYRALAERREANRFALSDLTHRLEGAGSHYAELHRSGSELERAASQATAAADRQAVRLCQRLEPFCGELEVRDIAPALLHLREQVSAETSPLRRAELRLLAGRSWAEFDREVRAAERLFAAHYGEDADFSRAVEHARHGPDQGLDEATQQALEGERGELERERAALRNDLDWLAEKPGNAPETKRRLLAAQARLEVSQQLIEALDLALDWLDLAESERASRLAPRLNEEASRWLASLTQGRYRDVVVDRHFAVRVLAEGALRESPYFSGATVDQIALSLRLALSTVVSRDLGELPLLFDDTLVQLDRGRFEEAFAALVQETTESGRQLLYLTFDEASAKMAASLGGRLVRLHRR